MHIFGREMVIGRKISAFILSAVFLPALMLASFHRHEVVPDPSGVSCAGCESHMPHSHLDGVQHTDECLICQFLTVIWLVTDNECHDTPAIEYTSKAVAAVVQPVLASFIFHGLRAPPAVFC